MGSIVGQITYDIVFMSAVIQRVFVTILFCPSYFSKGIYCQNWKWVRLRDNQLKERQQFETLFVY